MPLRNSLADAPLTRNEVLCTIVVIFVTVRAFEGADIWVGNKRICALAGHTLAP
jgi:hypothetical protein